jgi:hypothetical protein
MPLGFGKVVILEYIEVALGLLVVNDIGVAGSVSKRKVWRSKSCVLLVFCVFYSNSLTMAAAGAIRRRHLPDGGIQWLRMKPWMCSIGRCASHHTAASAWQ